MKEYTVEGMTCTNCAKNVAKAAEKAGFPKVDVSFQEHALRTEALSAQELLRLKQAISKAGYTLYIEGDEKQNDSFFHPALFISLGIGLYFMIAMFAIPAYPGRLFVDAGLGLLVLAIGFQRYGIKAFHSVLNGSPNMYVLILLGASVAYLYSVYLLIFNPEAHVYFEATALLIALVLLGERIEERALQATTSSLAQLAKEQVHPASLETADGTLKKVAAETLEKGMVIRINTGDAIPVDGKVLDGKGHADESLITGESHAIAKEEGSEVLGGSTLQSGSLRVEVLRPASLSTLANISSITQKAAEEKADIQRYADRVAAYFVPAVILLALGIFLLQYFLFHLPLNEAILRAVAVLVISCPCAMGLATPLAISVGVKKLTSYGILSKSARAVETFGRVQHLVLDKTGTLTDGSLTIEGIDVKEKWPEETIYALIGTIEEQSSHPLAKALCTHLGQTERLPLTEVMETSGKGMQGVWNHQAIKLGSSSFTGATADGSMFLTIDNELAAIIHVADRIKEHSAATIAYFKKQEVELTLLSGDREEAVQQLAHTLSVPYQAEVKPADKLQTIATIATNQTTAMVGDGINDGPALKRAHVGLTFSEASDLSMNAADIVLLGDDIAGLRRAHQISRATQRKIKENLFWALAYNIVAIPLAAMGFFTPVIAAALMFGSDLILIGNSYLLKRRSFTR